MWEQGREVWSLSTMLDLRIYCDGTVQQVPERLEPQESKQSYRFGSHRPVAIKVTRSDRKSKEYCPVLGLSNRCWRNKGEPVQVLSLKFDDFSLCPIPSLLGPVLGIRDTGMQASVLSLGSPFEGDTCKSRSIEEVVVLLQRGEVLWFR